MVSQVKDYDLEGKSLSGYTDGTDVYISYNQFLRVFGLHGIPDATLRRKKRTVIATDTYCSAPVLRQLKAANAISSEARKAAVLTLTQAHSLLEVCRKVKAIGGRGPQRDVAAGEEMDMDAPDSPIANGTSRSDSGGDPKSTSATAGGASSPASPRDGKEGGARPRRKKISLTANKHLSKEFAALKAFFTAETNHKRPGGKLSKSTMDKTLERVQVYLGYVERIQSTPTMTSLADMATLDAFFTWMKESGRKPGTRAAYGQSITHGLKYLHATGHAAVAEQPLTYVRQLIALYQREAEANRDKSWQDLSSRRKWLHWEEVIEVVRHQRDCYESQISPPERAIESQDYAILLLYTTIPPARAQEYRTLKLKLCSGDELRARSLPDGDNVLRINHEGSIASLEIGSYKNSAYLGRQTVDISSVDYLVPHLLDFIAKDRPILLGTKPDHYTLFMDTHGQPYTECRWTLHIQSIFHKHSGSSIGPNQLRSAFVTYLMDGELAADDSLARDVAAAMRHSVTYQRRVYDKRTSEDRTAKALKFSSDIAASGLGGSSASLGGSDGTKDDNHFDVGDIVATIDRNSTTSNHLIFLGKILRTAPRKREALLAYLAPVEDSDKKYRLKVGQETWWESYDAFVYPIDVVYDEQGDAYTCRSTTKEIWKCYRGHD